MLATRLLQVFVALNALIAIYNGGRFVLFGIDAVPVPPGLDVALQIPEPTLGLLDTWYRVLGWTWVVCGLMLAWITPAVAQQTAWFRMIFVAFMCVGVGRLAAVLTNGFTAENTAGAIALEVGIPLLCMVWQGWVARRTALNTR